MTQAAVRRVARSWPLLASAVVLGCGLAGAEPPPAPPKPGDPLRDGEIARVFGPDGSHAGTLTGETVAHVLVTRVAADLESPTSSAFTILREVIEEVLLDQEARRLGIAVTPEKVTAKENQLDTELRLKSGGQDNLAQQRKNRSMTHEGMRSRLRVQILMEEIAAHPQHLGALPTDAVKRQSQVSVVVVELHKKATIVYGIRTAWSEQPAALAPGVVALVNGEPVTRARYGAALFQFLDEADLRDAVYEVCTAKLLETEGVTLSEAEMDAELAYRAKVWEQQRELFSQEAWRERKVGYDEFLKASLKRTRAELRLDPYYRAYYGLVRRERAKVTDAMVEAEFAKKKDTHYGPAILVHEFHVSFDSPNALLGSRVKRSKREAMQMVASVKRQVDGGRPFTDIVRDVVAQHADPRTRVPDPTVNEGRRRLFNVSADQLLFAAAAKLRDGQLSEPVETLSELRLLLRVKEEPAKRLDDVRDAVREHLAGLEAQYVMRGDPRKPVVPGEPVKDGGLQNDPKRVQIRIPIRGG